MIESIVILGNHIQALGLARQAKEIEMPVTLITSSPISVARFSKAVKNFIVLKNSGGLMTVLDKLYTGKKSALLFPTNDEMVAFLVRHYEELNKKFYLGIPNLETTATFYSKRSTFQFASRHNIPVPQTWTPENKEELMEISNSLKYPVVLKPDVMHSFHKTTGKKAFKCSSKEELVEKTNEILLHFSIKDLIFQEFIEGGPKNLYSYGTYAHKGKPLASVMVNRIRQNPMTFGNSTTFAKSCNIKEIKELAEKILELTNYTGFAEIEFMYDKESGQYKFLEINTRAWKWHSISNAYGFSFIEKLVSAVNKNDLTQITNFNKNVAWVDRLTDFAVVSKEVLRSKMKITDVFESYKIRKEYAVWSKRDVLPFIMYVVMSPILYFKRH